MADEEKPFECTEAGCGMRFTNEDHLSVHLKKHDMSLALSLSSGLGNLSPLALFTDQTPTPTKFLRNCEEIGLFQDLNLNKNPFDDSFKKAMDDPLDMETSTSDSTLQIPCPDINNLDTPQPTIPKIVIDIDEVAEVEIAGEKKIDSGLASIVPKKRKKYLTQSMATSTTSEDEEEPVIGSSSADLESSPSPAKIPAKGGHSSPPTISSSTGELRQGTVITSDPSEPRQISTPSTMMVQVMLELPGGQTVPVAVPATNLSSLQMKSISQQQIIQLPSVINQPNQIQLVNINKNLQNIPHVVASSAQVVPSVSVNNTSVTITTTPTPPSAANLPLSVRAFKLETSPLAQGAVISQQGKNQATAKTKVTPEKATIIQPPTPVVISTPSVSPKHIPGGSQAYTKQRLKAALQQMTTPSSSQKISQIFQMVNDMPIKREPQMSPIPVESSCMVSSTGTVSSPEDRMSFYGATPLGSVAPDSFDGEDAEERRKKFLERNRAAAARCRQKRKKWVTNLETKADELTNVNTKLSIEIKSLREEIAQLKTLLLAHKDCPVTQQQRSQGQITPKTYVIETSQAEPTSVETTTIDIPKTVTAISDDIREISTVTLNQPLQTASTIVNASLIPNIITLNQSSLQTSAAQLVNGGVVPSIIALDQSEAEALGHSSVGGDLLPSIITIDQNGCETRPLSVITGPNSLHMIPKIINVENLLQKPDKFQKS